MLNQQMDVGEPVSVGSPTKEISVSVVIPVLNEAATVRSLYRQLAGVLPRIALEWELLFIDDGSTDGTAAEIKALCAEDQRVKALVFRRNFGKSAALSAGLRRASADVIVTMDGDLQDDPAELPKLVARLQEGCDMVVGWRSPRRDPLSKVLPSRLFNAVTRSVTGVRVHDINCGFKVLRREMVPFLKCYGELHRYLPVLASWLGYRVGEAMITHHPRSSGQSKFKRERYLRGFLDLVTVNFLTKYNKKPLHMLGSLGVSLIASGLLINSYLAVLWIMGRGIGQRPLLVLGVLLLIVGVQIISFGLLAEMLTNLLHVREDDIYMVKASHGFLDRA